MLYLRKPSRAVQRHLNTINDQQRRKVDAIAAAQTQLLTAETLPVLHTSAVPSDTDTLTSSLTALQTAVPQYIERGCGSLAPLLSGLLRLNDKPYSLDRHFVFEPLFETCMPSSLLVKSGRQIGKCVRRSSDPTVWCADGRLVGTADVRIGDELLSYDEQFRPVRGRVTGIFDSGVKRCYRVTTRLGAELEITAEHRIRVLSGYKTLLELEVGDRICAPRRSGVFGNREAPEARVVLTALLIGDGNCATSRTCVLTSETPDVIDVAQRWPLLAPVLDVRNKSNRTREVLFSTDPRYTLRQWLQEDGLWGAYSYEKKIPAWVFQLPRKQLQQFISWLFATDGSLKPPRTIEYYSTSRTLARQVRSLLVKFGIPASISCKPAGYRGKTGEYKRCRDCWTVRVETRLGLETFFKNFTVPGRPSFSLPDVVENNNRDTLPQKETQQLIDRLAIGLRGKHTTSFQKSGLRQKLKYPPQREKVRSYLAHFRKHHADPALTARLAAACSEDVMWDEIVSIEDIGNHETLDFEVAKSHNFVLDGIDVHNSQTQCARLILMCATIPNFRVLVVMPLFELVRRFSSNYVHPMITSSPLASVWCNSRQAGNVLQRNFRHNGSAIYFSFASTSADRTRGVPATCTCIDELQDMDSTFIPIIRETMSGSPFPPLEIKTGTPKTFDGTVEVEWADSSQAEFMIKCGCGKENYPRIDLDLDAMMGPKIVTRPITAREPGVVCAKCGRPLNVRENGRWIHTVPENRSREGFHIPQIIVPQHYEDDTKWHMLQAKRRGEMQMQTYQFYNEVLGESYDSGSKLITVEDLRRVAVLHPNLIEAAKAVPRNRHIRRCLGVDWGGGGESMISYTTVAVVGLCPDGRVEVIFGWRCPNLHDHDLEVRTILHLFVLFGCNFLAHDFNGIGDIQETMLHKAGLPAELIHPVSYIAHANGAMMIEVPENEETHQRWHYRLVKSRSLTFLAALIRRQRVLFFADDYKNQDNRGLLRDFTTLVQDFLDSRAGRSIYNVIHNKKLGPDDFAHAVNYAACALFHERGVWPSLLEAADSGDAEFPLSGLPHTLSEYEHMDFDPRSLVL